jgi:hypothetical protein
VAVKLNTKQFVNKFGSEKGKARYKKTGKADGEIIGYCMKTAKQKYEQVTVVKEGRANFYILGAKLPKEVKREENRGNKEQLETEFELKSLMLSYLVKSKEGDFTLGKWIQTLGIANEKLLNAQYNGNIFKHLENLTKEFQKLPKYLQYNHCQDDIEMLASFTSEETKRMKSNLKSVFKKLVDDRFMEHKTAWYGQTVNGSRRKVNMDEVARINNLRDRLLDEHGITRSRLFNKGKAEVKAFEEEFHKQLKETLGLVYIYESHKCKLKAANLHQLENLDVKYDADEHSQLILTEEYKKKFYNRSIVLAENRQRNTNSGTGRIKSLKIMKQYVPLHKVLLEYFNMKPMFKVESFEFEGVTFRLLDFSVRPLEHFEAIREGKYSAFNDISYEVNKLLKGQRMMANIEKEQIKRNLEEQERLKAEKVIAEWNERKAKTEEFRKQLKAEKVAEAERILAIINAS